MHLLDVRGLNVTFQSRQNRLRVVTNLSFYIGTGEVFGLVGESGCGKSVTAYSILGLLPQNASAEGDIVFLNQDLLKLDPAAMRALRGKEIAMVFQEPMTSLNPVLNIGYQIAEVLVAHLGMSKPDAMAMAVELMRSVKIPSPEVRVREYPHQMSGGMRQRIMIAMAIACKPALLIADEPTTALDVTIQAEILNLLKTLKDGRHMSMLFITHDLGIVSEITERVGVMYAGRIVETAPTRELLDTPRHPYTMGLLDSLPVARGKPLKPIQGTVPLPDSIPQGCTFSDRCRYVIGACRQEEPALLEVSPSHYARCIRTGEITWQSWK